MAEIALSVAAKIAEYLVDPIIRCASYIFCVNKFVGDSRKARTQLALRQKDMKERAERATRNAEKVVEPVETWLNDVENVLEEVQKLEESADASKSCLNVRLRYSLTKKVASKTQKMNELHKQLNELDKSKISEPIELPGMKFFYPKDFEWFDSTKSAYDKILRAIQEDKSSVIGLVGMGRSGKTTLAKVVGNKVQELKLFDKVVMADVSQDPKVRDIQGEIADQLSFTLKEETVRGRAQRLSERLKTEKILIILDDVWMKLDLEAIGIPMNENNQNCSILLTTRKQEVCESMDCQNITQLSMLTENEGWTLFKQCAQIAGDSSEDLGEVAKRIANKCQGLLVAILKVGSTLKGKAFDEWLLALSKLENSLLTKQLAKSLFFLCCMFPEDHEIHKEDLFRFGSELCREQGSANLDTMETTRREYNVAVNALIDCHLLMPTNKKEFIKMHDSIRDVALWIASNEDQAIMITSKVIPRMLKGDETIKHTAIISLWDIAFSYTWRVKKPVLGKTLSVPQSIRSLTNLRTLCLRGYNLGDISVLASIEGLEILDLRGSSIIELPNEIGALKKLKLLDLFYCNIEKNNQYEVITRCSLLQELYISAHGDYSVENVSFPKLDRYFIWLSKIDVSNFDDSQYYDFKNDGGLRHLGIDLEDFDKHSLNESIKDLFLRAEGLYLKSIQGHKNIILEMDKQHIDRLTCLQLDSCSGMKCLVDPATLVNTIANFVDANVTQAEALFSKLLFLWLHDMHDLEELIRGPSSSCSMQKLQELWISNCPHLCSASFLRNLNLCSLKILRLKGLPQLTSTLFTPSIAQTFVMLEDVIIDSCENLECIIAQDMEEENNKKTLCFPRLGRIFLYNCPKMKTISATTVTILSWLQILVVHDCNELEQIISSDSKEARHLRNLSAPSQQVCFPELWWIDIQRCNKLKCIFSYSMACHCPRLQNLIIGSCSQLEQVVKFEHKATGDEGRGAANVDEKHGKHVLFPIFSKLQVKKLPNLTAIFPGYEFKSNHEIVDCPNYMWSSTST